MSASPTPCASNGERSKSGHHPGAADLQPKALDGAPLSPHAKIGWLGKFALSVCVTLLVIGIFEVTVRLYAHLTSQERLIMIDNLVGWRLAPNVRRQYDKEAQPYFIVTNSKGLRDAEHSYDKPQGVFRIVVIGDSFVFGAGGVDASNRFTELLQRRSRHTEVINMGVPAYGTDQEYSYLASEGIRYHPDLVILCAFYNDFKESFSTINPSNGRPKGYFSLDGDNLVFHPPSFSTFYKLSQHSYLLGFADLALSKISNAYHKGRSRQQVVPGARARIATFKQLYASTSDVCQNNGAAFVLVYFPFQGQNSKSIIQQVMDDLAATRNIRTLDLMDTMLHADAMRSTYFRQDIHFNEYGHQVVAEALLKYLEGNGLLPSTNTESSSLH